MELPAQYLLPQWWKELFISCLYPIEVGKFSVFPYKQRRTTILQFLQNLKKISLLALVVSGVIFLWSSRQKSIYPLPGEILPSLQGDPLQKQTQKSAYEFTYRGKSYRISPRAEYEIQGMVVTHNDISAFDDIYHTRDSVDFKDVCLIWGDNLQSDDYFRIKFWSEPWTCQLWADDRADLVRFRLDQISNNHLLSGSSSVREKIQSVVRGDQIVLRGQLIDYCPLDRPTQLRKTSLDRNDTGNGACEVLMVDSIQILKVNRSEWRTVWRISRFAFFSSLFLQILCFFTIPGLQLQKKKHETEAREEEYRKRMSGELLPDHPTEPHEKNS